MKRIISMAIAALFLGGCASYFKRQACEKANWYQHGFDVAMSGKRLDADGLVKECQKVEAKMSFAELDTGFKAGMGKYCTQDNIFAVGKAGDPFAFEMCDGESMKKMKAKYAEGLQVFCTPENAQRFGSAGGIYKNVCPKDKEEAWINEYRKGRKIWLTSVIREKEFKRQDIQGEIWSLQSKRNSLRAQANSIVAIPIIHREQVYDALTGTYHEQTTQQPDLDAQMRRDGLTNQANNVDLEISSRESELRTLNDEISKLRTELAAL